MTDISLTLIDPIEVRILDRGGPNSEGLFPVGWGQGLSLVFVDTEKAEQFASDLLKACQEIKARQAQPLDLDALEREFRSTK